MLSSNGMDEASQVTRVTQPVPATEDISLLQTLRDVDTDFLLWLNSLSSWPPVAILFRIVSRLGDGIFWYSLIGVMLYEQHYVAALHLMAVALIGLAIYKVLKSYTVRPRPYVNHPDIVLRARPLDEYSFPSGHTLHAFSLTIVSLYYFPVLGLFLVPFTLLVAASRSILGLHYPSDVMAGSSIGILVASLSLAVTSLF